ncbi:MAG: putative helicase [uncultured archaeon A07HR67]|nr:MAG: putative helicase [uncultured archaeon A07HR67]
MDPDRIPAAFPAPSFRGTQEQALADVRDAFAAGNDVVLVRAPTGSGKSLLARAVMGAARTASEAAPSEPIDAYYTTPQVSQLDDVAADDLLDDLSVIRGKSNYGCILPGEHDTPVDRAPCAREQGFDCSIKHRCPYFSDRAVASGSRFAAMTLAYFMRTAGSETFGTRDVVVIDEAHGLAEWAEMYATIELSPERVPVWEDVSVPDVERDAGDDEDALDRTARFAETLLGVAKRAKDDLTGRPELSREEVARRDRLGELVSEVGWFLEEYRDPDSPTTWVVDQPDGAGSSLAIKPLDPARYLTHTVWDRGERFALLSATILSKTAFCRGVGLDPSDVALVDVEHTFPLAHRRLYDVTQGSMTYENRDETIPKIARLIVRLMAEHPDEKGLIHAHSYDIAGRLVERLGEFGVAARVRRHGRENRDAELEAWLASPEPDVFVSVKMEEALDLAGDRCRWQVVCKAPYRNTNDSRVARRLADDRWGWYHRTALRTVIQACGRVVRAPDDHGVTYLADESLIDLFGRARAAMPAWFRDQVDAMTTPEYAAFDPEAALAGIDATPSGPGRAGRGGGTRGSAVSAEEDGLGGDAPGETTRTRSETDAERRSDHPLSDVWGDG